MTSLSVAGISYRTKLLSRDRAEQFARCLGANPAFRGVAVHPSARRADRFFVSYLPANPERQADLLRRVQAVQDGRAEAQFDLYEVFQDPSGKFYWVLRQDTGEVYETTFLNCNCPHYEHRCRQAGCTCKHSGVVRRAVDRGEVGQFTRTVPQAPADDPFAGETPAPPAAKRWEDRSRAERNFLFSNGCDC